MAGYHTLDSIGQTVGRLQTLVDDTRGGIREPLPPSSNGAYASLVNAADADAIVASLEQAVHGSVFAEVLQDQQVRLALVETLKNVLIRQIEHSFSNRIDPYGNAWAPLKQPSRATGAMQRGAIESIRQGTVTAEGFRSADGLQVSYWRFHDQGTSRIPARPFWAVSSEVLDAINEFVVEESVRRLSAGISSELNLPF